MKKSIFCLLFILFLFYPCLFAQAVKIVNVRGKVVLKKAPSYSWEKAEVDIYLDVKAEIKTGQYSECTLAFDEDLQNALTIKEKSHVIIAGSKSGNIFLNQGRVFFLIDNPTKLSEFKVRTPTAVAGVRGTGLSVKYDIGGTTVACFEEEIYVRGVPKRLKKTAKKYVSEGFGISVNSEGELNTTFALDSKDYRQWYLFKKHIEGMRVKIQSSNSKTSPVIKLKGTPAAVPAYPPWQKGIREVIKDYNKKIQERDKSYQKLYDR